MNPDILKAMADTAVRHLNNHKEHTLAMFKIGSELTKHPTSIPIRQLGVMLGINYVEISLAKSLAKKFECDEIKFKEYCESTVQSWQWKRVKHFKPKSYSAHKDTIAERLSQMYESVKLYIWQHKENTPELKDVHEQLHRIRKSINKFVPAQNVIFDENFIRYHSCCCCGDYPPPPEGYHVEQMNDGTLNYVKFPVCNACLEERKAPDYKMIASMYASYSINLEEALEGLIR